MSRFVNNFIKSCLILFLTTSCNGQSSNLINGIYDDLYIVKNEENIITGFINYEEENFACKLYFFGALKKNSKQLAITILNLNDFNFSKGTCLLDEDYITIKSDSIIFPCQRKVDLYNGEVFYFKKSVDFNELSVIKEDKVYLYDKIGGDYKLTPKKSYLIKSDFIIVDERQDNWLKIRYLKNLNKYYWIDIKNIIPR